MDLPRILPLDNEERIRTLTCDGLKTRGITDHQCLGLAKHEWRHTQGSAKIASATTFAAAAAANSEPHHHQSNSASPYQQLPRSLFC